MRIQMPRVIFWRCAIPGRKALRIVLALTVCLSFCGIVYYLRSLPYQELHYYDFKLQKPHHHHHSRQNAYYSSNPILDPGSAETTANRSGTRPQPLPQPQPQPQPTRPSPYRQVRGLDLFLYSAIFNDREPNPGEANIIITAFDSSGTDSLQCCVVTETEDRLYTTQATVYYKFYVEDVLGPFLEMFKNAPTKAKQYACVVPHLGFKISHVTLTTEECPAEEQDYLPVVYPRLHPQGLALCAKAAFGDKLDPHKLMEWFEVQRLLGVDHVQIMDLDNPERIQKVFRYYTDMGFLNALPYQLPGPPYGRGLDWTHWKAEQASHDESFPILDCKQRLRGYTYVMGHDMDEVLMPARHQSIKELIRDQLMKQPDAAGFFFYTQFFVYDWGPVNMDSDVHFFRFLNSTLPRNECKKYVYISNRVEQARTHTFYERSPYQKYFVPEEDAILHHYRKCPHVWDTCNPPRMTDKSMLRFQGVLEERLQKARHSTGLYPSPKP